MPPFVRRLLQLALVAAAIAVAALLVRARSHSPSPDGAHAASKAEGAAAPAGRAVPVLVAAAERRDVPVWLEGLGTVAAWQQVTVRPQVDGRLDRVLFREGQVVRRGQVLAQIDPRPFLVQLHQAEGALARDRAQLRAAQKDAVRYKELVAGKLIAQQQLDTQVATVGQSEGALRMDQAAVESARLNLDYAQVKSPLDGIVGVRLVDAGNVVHAADPNGLVVVTQLDPAAVYFTLPEDDLAQVSAALQRGAAPVEAWSRDGRDKLAEGRLLVVDNQINQATATLRLKAMFKNPAHRLWPNEFVKARVLVDTRKDALVVPGPAVQRGPQGTFVYVVGEDRTAQLKPVEVVLSTDDLAVLGRGVSPGEQVVVEGQNQLRPGAAVSVRPAAGGAGTQAGGAARGAGGPGAKGAARAGGR